MTPREGLDLAVSIFGSENALARAIGFSADAFNKARRRDRLTADMCKNIEVVTKRKVTRKVLRPDLFGNAPVLVKNSWVRGLNRRARWRR